MIEVQNLSKYFGSKKAVDDVSFRVAKGEILGFLGPNGAGKSTTMRMITGFIPPSAGTVVIGGCGIGQDPINARRQIGYLPENAPVYPDMTVEKYLDFIAEVRGFQGARRKSAVAATIEKCFLQEVRFQTISTLSKGYKQRVCFAQSILHDPDYLILDEPTDGLDPNQKHEVRQMILQMSAKKAIILSTHILDEVEAVCSRALIITSGRIVADDTPENLKSRSTIHGAISLALAAEDPDTALADLKTLAGVASVELLGRNGHDLNLRLHPETHAPELIHRIFAGVYARQYRVHSIFVEKGRLDEVFRTITQGVAS